MIGSLKIKIDKDSTTGEVRVPPELMDLLTRFAGHRDLCDQCTEGWEQKTGHYCWTGGLLMDELIHHPLVEFIPEGGQGEG